VVETTWHRFGYKLPHVVEAFAQDHHEAGDMTSLATAEVCRGSSRPADGRMDCESRSGSSIRLYPAHFKRIKLVHREQLPAARQTSDILPRVTRRLAARSALQRRISPFAANVFPPRLSTCGNWPRRHPFPHGRRSLSACELCYIRIVSPFRAGCVWGRAGKHQRHRRKMSLLQRLRIGRFCLPSRSSWAI
jgi:hypothetical protein